MQTVTTNTRPAQLAIWPAPEWAETVTTDGDLIECSRTLGTVSDPECADSTLAVTLVQRDEVRTTRNQIEIEVVRHPVEVVVGDVSLTPEGTEALTGLLITATTLMSDTTRAVEEPKPMR